MCTMSKNCEALINTSDPNFQGERLSHAVGCAFAICLEKKQERDRLNVTMSFNKDDSTFTRFGSFRQGTITERLQVRGLIQ